MAYLHSLACGSLQGTGHVYYGRIAAQEHDSERHDYRKSLQAEEHHQRSRPQGRDRVAISNWLRPAPEPVVEVVMLAPARHQAAATSISSPAPRRCTLRSPNGPVSAGGASAALLLLLLEGGAFARGLPAILHAHGSLLSAGRVGGSARRRPSIIDRPCQGAQPPDRLNRDSPAAEECAIPAWEERRPPAFRPVARQLEVIALPRHAGGEATDGAGQQLDDHQEPPLVAALHRWLGGWLGRDAFSYHHRQ
jgi:hypothetical protein